MRSTYKCEGSCNGGGGGGGGGGDGGGGGRRVRIITHTLNSLAYHSPTHPPTHPYIKSVLTFIRVMYACKLPVCMNNLTKVGIQRHSQHLGQWQGSGASGVTVRWYGGRMVANGMVGGMAWQTWVLPPRARSSSMTSSWPSGSAISYLTLYNDCLVMRSYCRLVASWLRMS